jgi:hypothetical protein
VRGLFDGLARLLARGLVTVFGESEEARARPEPPPMHWRFGYRGPAACGARDEPGAPPPLYTVEVARVTCPECARRAANAEAARKAKVR